jgi:hypothetical protein
LGVHKVVLHSALVNNVCDKSCFENRWKIEIFSDEKPPISSDKEILRVGSCLTFIPGSGRWKEKRNQSEIKLWTRATGEKFRKDLPGRNLHLIIYYLEKSCQIYAEVFSPGLCSKKKAECNLLETLLPFFRRAFRFPFVCSAPSPHPTFQTNFQFL